MLVTLAGMKILRIGSKENAYPPMLVTLSGMAALVRLTQ
jgi:hypothetical protein